MKNAMIIVTSLILSMAVKAETKFEYEITKANGEEKSAGAKGRLSLLIKGANSPLPALKFDVPTSILVRLVEAKFGNNKLAMVLQMDEFNLEYREYSIKSEEWKLIRSTKLCDLSGFRATHLKKVTISNFGEVKVRFGKNTADHKGPVKWENIVLHGLDADNDDDTLEDYSLKDDGNFVKTSMIRQEQQEKEPSVRK